VTGMRFVRDRGVRSRVRERRVGPGRGRELVVRSALAW